MQEFIERLDFIEEADSRQQSKVKYKNPKILDYIKSWIFAGK